MSHFRLNGKTYALAPIDSITPRDLLTFPIDAAEALRRPITWHEIETAFREVDAMDNADEHPLGEFLIMVSWWISLRAAGESTSFRDFLDGPVPTWVVEEIKVPEDHKPGKPQARKGKKKRKSGNPQRSAQLVAPDLQALASTTPATSPSASAPTSSD